MSGVGFTLNSVFIHFSNWCLSKNGWYFTIRCSTPAFCSSLGIDSSQLNFDRTFFFCPSNSVGFNCCLCLGEWWSQRWCVSLPCSVLLDHTSPGLVIIVWHQFLSVSETTGWECLETTLGGFSRAALVSALLASCSLLAARSSSWSLLLLHSCVGVVQRISNFCHCFPLCQSD